MNDQKDPSENVVQLFFITNRIREQLDNMTFESNLEIVLNIYNKVKELIGSISPDQLTILPELNKNPSINDIKFAFGIVYGITLPLVLKYHEDFEQIVSISKRFSGEESHDFLEPHNELLFALSLNKNWASSALFLSMLEITLYNKLIELGNNGNDVYNNMNFNQKIKKISEDAKNQGLTIDSLFADSFYKIRNKIIHEGKIPTENEAKEIEQFVKKFYSDISQLKNGHP